MIGKLYTVQNRLLFGMYLTGCQSRPYAESTELWDRTGG